MTNKSKLENLTYILKSPDANIILSAKEGRKAFVEVGGFRAFIILYLHKKYPLQFSLYHNQIVDLMEDGRNFIGILGFRGCGKSSIAEDYALYALVTGKSRYTIYMGSTDAKSRSAVQNIKAEIESNDELRDDYDIVIDKAEQKMKHTWSESKIVMNGCALEAKSRGAKVRGVKFMDSRVTLIIADDLEDTENTKSDEMRKKTREWFFTELIPAMAPDEIGENTKVIMIGNLVHRDCLLAHLENKKDENKDIIKILRFPLIDENADITWEAMYPNREAVEKQKKIVYLSGEGLGPVIWAREYLLKTIDESEQIIKQTDIQYYPDEWLQRAKISSVVGVDLAISKKQTADYTAMVKIYAVYNDAGEKRYLVAPNNVKERLSFTETILKAKSLKLEMPPNNKFFVEDVAYQKSAIEVMEKNGLNVVGVRPVGDKRARLAAVSPYIKSGLVLFPKSGCSDILNEVINLGVETHDDQCDALVHAINGIIDTTSNDIFIV